MKKNKFSFSNALTWVAIIAVAVVVGTLLAPIVSGYLTPATETVASLLV